MVEVRDGHTEKQAAMSAHNYFADFAIPVEAAFDAGWDAALTTAAAEVDALRETILQQGESAATAAKEYAENMAALRERVAVLSKGVELLREIDSHWRTRQSDNYLYRLDQYIAALKEPKS